MGRKRTRTIDNFIYERGLGDWKPPRPDKQLSWEAIRALYGRAIRVAKTDSEYWGQSQSDSYSTSKLDKEELQKKCTQLRDESQRLYEELMMQCWGWVEHGEKLRSVRIHDTFQDQGLSFSKAPFALQAELWYRAVAWEFSGWRFDMARQYFDGEMQKLDDEIETLDKQIDEAIDKEQEVKNKDVAQKELAAISEKIDEMMKKRDKLNREFFALDDKEDAWFDDYYKQRELLHYWLELRGFKLSSNDIRYRLGTFVV